MGETNWWKSPRERYYHDNAFHTLVDTLVNNIIACNYTPSELREAVILASIIYHEMHSQTHFLPREVINWLEGKEDSDGYTN
jgi:hypothetical protein